MSCAQGVFLHHIFALGANVNKSELKSEVLEHIREIYAIIRRPYDAYPLRLCIVA